MAVGFAKAVASAKQALEESGYAYYTISDAKDEGSKWVIKADTLVRKVTILVDRNTGEVLRLFESK